MIIKKPSGGGGGGGSSVTASATNGNVNVDGQELQVYDDTAITDAIESNSEAIVSNTEAIAGKTDVGHVHNLSQITDVDATDRTNGYALIYDSASNKYKSQPLPAGSGSGATSLDGLTDVDTTSTPPEEGNALTFQSGLWKPGVGSASDTIKQLGSDGSYNLLDPTAYTDPGFYYRYTDGAKTALTGFASSAFIPVVYGALYRNNWGGNVTFWDEDKVFVKGLDNLDGSKPFAVDDASIKYMRISVPPNLSNLVVTRERFTPKGNVFVPRSERYLLPAEKFKVQEFKPNATMPLFIETPELGGNQPIHPSVLAFDTPWNGYKYWMAYTPFPNKTDTQENPHLAVSNDLIKWVAPPGVTLPLEGRPTDGAAGSSGPYNSDTHLVYNAATSTLEIWWRSVYQGSNRYETVKRRTSTDGVNWTSTEALATTLGLGYTGWEHLISPAAFIKDGVYKIYVMEDRKVKAYESADGTNWVDKGFVVKAGTTDTIFTWHLYVIYNEQKNIYELLNYLHPTGDLTDVGGWLEHFTSDDGMNWTQTPGFYVAPSPDLNMWDSRSLYRSCLLFTNSKYYMFYTGIQDVGSGSQWQIGLSISDDDNIMTLKGIDSTWKHLMAQPTRENPMGNFGDSVYDVSADRMIFCVNKDGTKTWISEGGGSAAPTSKWAGKIWNVMGDSISFTTFADTPYWKAIQTKIGMTVNNYAVNGSGYNTNGMNGSNMFHIHVSGMAANADLITVFGGVNDWNENTHQFILGSFGDTDPDATFFGAVEDTFSQLVTKYPTKPIAVFTPLPFQRAWYGRAHPQWTGLTPKALNTTVTPTTLNGHYYKCTTAGTTGSSSSEPIWPTASGATVTDGTVVWTESGAEDTGGATLEQVADAIIAVANKYSFPVLDLHRMANAYPWNATFRSTYMPDGLHPNNAFHALLADKILSFLDGL